MEEVLILWVWYLIHETLHLLDFLVFQPVILFDWFIMLCIPRLIKLHLFHLSFCRILVAIMLLRFIQIALIEPSSLLSMGFLPISLAQPAELMPALFACHVHAPLVFLNWPLASGALFCVCLYPQLIDVFIFSWG
jgi:hypothetical protein